MIFPISGPPSSGKTTTLNDTLSLLESLGLKIGARYSITHQDFTEKYDLAELRKDPEAYLDYQMRLLQKTIEQDLSLAQSYDILLTDRSVFDGFLYVILYVQQNPNKELFHYFRLASDHAKNYRKAFVLEPLPSFEYNGIRDLDKDYCYDMFKALLSFSKSFKVPALSRSERAHLVADKILQCWYSRHERNSGS